MLKNIVVVGAGGHALEICDLLEAINTASPDGPRYNILGHLVESGHEPPPGSSPTIHPILGDFDWAARFQGELYAVIAVGAPALRQRLARQAATSNLKFETLVHPQAILAGPVELGSGVVIGAGAILTNRVKVANHVHINIGATVSHGCVLEDFVTVSPGVNIAGNVLVEQGAFIGLGAKIIEKRKIGHSSVIGAGCVVIHDVPPRSTVAGVPGRLIKQEGRLNGP